MVDPDRQRPTIVNLSLFTNYYYYYLITISNVIPFVTALYDNEHQKKKGHAYLLALLLIQGTLICITRH